MSIKRARKPRPLKVNFSTLTISGRIIRHHFGPRPTGLEERSYGLEEARELEKWFNQASAYLESIEPVI